MVAVLCGAQTLLAQGSSVATAGLGHVGLAHHRGRPSVRTVGREDIPAVQCLGDLGEGLASREQRPDLLPPFIIPVVALRVGQPNVLGDEVPAGRLEGRVVVGRGCPLGARLRPDRMRIDPCGGSTAASRTSRQGVGRARPSARGHPSRQACGAGPRPCYLRRRRQLLPSPPSHLSRVVALLRFLHSPRRASLRRLTTSPPKPSPVQYPQAIHRKSLSST